MIEDLLNLNDVQLRALGEALEGRRLSQPFSVSSLERLLPGSPADVLARSLNAIVAAGPFTETALSLFVNGILRDRELRSSATSGVELVATGPDVTGLLHRETSVVVHDLFAHAEECVLVAGYAVYQGQKIFKALGDRMLVRPDLFVRLFLDVRRPPGDASPRTEIVKRFVERFRQDDWPIDSPLPHVYFDTRSLEPSAAGRSSLHAKCVVVDQQTTLISSANFTEAAQDRNIEMGLLTKQREIAQQVILFFDRLVEEKLLERVL